jgi:AcrR family transcriptional regulator
MSRPSRARGAPAKELKRRAILDCAAALFMESRRLASMADIASHAGVSKALLYVYFKTKEDLYLTLLNERLEEWRSAMAQRLRARRGRMTIAALTEAIVAPGESDPMALPLSVSVLAEAERSASSAVVAEHKRSVVEGTAALAQLLCARFPDLSPAAAASIVIRAFALLVGLSAVHDQGPNVAWIGRAVGHRAFASDLAQERREAVAALLRGCLSR